MTRLKTSVVELKIPSSRNAPGEGGGGVRGVVASSVYTLMFET